MFTQVTRTLCLALPGGCLAKDRKQYVDLYISIVVLRHSLYFISSRG